MPCSSPIDGGAIGTVREADEAIVRAAMAAAAAGFPAWAATPVDERAAVLERAADRLEANRGALLALLQNEGGKTLDDALAELREAIDYCRYYAAQARSCARAAADAGADRREQCAALSRPRRLRLHQPVEFSAGDLSRPGQRRARRRQRRRRQARRADAAGRRARASRCCTRPAFRRPRCIFVPGDGAVGASLVADPRVAGVVFTGSTEVGRAINRALAAKSGPIVPLIAETGGINAMIVDATALPEQVIDDVITSAFRSAGQRCSALRLLCLQDDVADRMLDMLIGAARELKIGDPRDLATHVGPVIDAEAKAKLDSWIAGMERAGRVRFRWDRDRALPAAGTYVAPAIIELDRARDLKEEVFGPVLHVVRWRADELDALLDDIAANGTALTLGIHSRIDLTVERIAARLPHGNIYVNRNMIGAVVGTQPFGGTRLSGTGPKAGGPNYLRRFAAEQVVTDQHGGRRRQCRTVGAG